MLRDLKSYKFLLAILAISAATYSSALISYAATQLSAGPTVTALTVSKTSMTGGAPLSGVVTLDRVAPFGGVNVSLTTSATEVTAPATVAVPAGKTSATFAITTTPVDREISVVVTAEAPPGNQKVARFTVLAPVPKSLTLSSPSTVGGQTVRATVGLTGPAPSKGLTLQLTSSNTATASVPSSISISAGKQNESFDVTTTRVSVETPVTISINSPEVVGATLTVILPPVPELVSMTCSSSSIPTNATPINLVFDRTLIAQHGVQFTSSNPAVLPVPPLIHFQSGINSIPIFVTPTQVASVTAVTITAVSGNSTKSVTTTVHPLVLETFSSSATEVLGGVRPLVTIALNLPRNEDTAIGLSANSGLVSIPNSIIIPARSSSSNPATVTFDVNTLVATAPTPVTITASMPAVLGGGTKTVTITILPVAVASLSLETQSCDLSKDCPGTISGTVTLNGAAPPEGVTIAIASNRTQSATVSPSSILISQGQSSATFTVSIAQGAAIGNAEISARIGSGSAKNVTLELVRTFMGVESMTLSTNSTTGGTPITGTVNVGQFVVSGNGPQVRTPVTPTQFLTNITVNVSGNGPQQQLSLNVPAGQSSGTFTYTPPPASATETRNLTAFANAQFMGDGAGRSAVLTVNPATFNSFTLSEINVQGGREVTGTIQMSGPVPFSSSVTVTSSDPAAASIVSSNFVSGDPTGTVRVGTSASVSVPTPVTLTASFAGQTTTAQLTVTKPSVLSGISFPSTRILSGIPTTLRIDLDGPAPNGGALVSLNSSTPSVLPIFQPSVTIPAGQNTTSVQLSPTNAANPTPVVITASFANQTKTTQVTIEPVALDVCSAISEPVTSGTAINCSVSLINAGMVAPEGGIQFGIQNPNPSLVSLPSTLTIPAGQTATTLQIVTQHVTQATVLNLQLTLPGQGIGRTFTLVP